MTPNPTPRRQSGQLFGPVTATGGVIFALAIVSYVAGWRLGWTELLVVAAACLVALTLAVPFVVGRSRLHVERRIRVDRIAVGDTLHVELVVTNPGRIPSRRVEIHELLDGDELTLLTPALGAGETEPVPYTLTPPRRTKLSVGPAVISRADPLGLLRRSVSQSRTDTCWVYPATRLLAPLPVGFAKDLEGPTSDTSPVGDVAFHAVRPYNFGDDRRHIHWMSTARTGELMVRHYVDNRRPHLAVLLDTAAEFYDDESFETAVSAAASMSASMLDQRLPVSVRIGQHTVIGSRRRADRAMVLEAFTQCETSYGDADGIAVNVAEFIRTERSASAIAVITGSRPAEDLLAAVVHARRHARVIVVPAAAPGAGIVALPGARVVPAHDLDGFAFGWAAMTR